MPLTHPLIVPAIRLDHDAEAETRKAFERAKQPWVAGFILFGGEAEQVAKLTADLRDAADRPIFISADMERGAGQQVAGLTRLPDFGIYGLAATPDEVAAHAELTAREAGSVGIDVLFGPCLDVRSEMDNPILGNRSFGFDPQRVADLGSAWISGAQRGGALPVAKHAPGHGGTREDSHEALPVVHADEQTLLARDLMPFAKALGLSRCPALMAAHVAYPALDAEGTIATFSAPILGKLRELAGPDATDLLLFTDAMMMAGATVPGGEPEAAALALEAGCDMLLYPDEPEAIAAALDDGWWGPRSVARRDAFLARGAALRADLADPHGCGEPTPAIEDAPRRVAARALRMAGGVVPYPQLLVLVDDDGIEARGDLLAAAAARRGTPVVRLRAGEDTTFVLPESPEDGPRYLNVAVVVFAQARAWKGASGVSEAGRELVRTVQAAVHARPGFADVTWCAPRPGGAMGRHVPGNGPQVERALVKALFDEVAGSV